MRFFIVVCNIECYGIYLTYDTNKNRWWAFPHMMMPEARTGINEMTWYML